MPDSQSQTELRNAYENVKRECKRDWGSERASIAIRNLVLLSLDFLNSECTQTDLISLVPGKHYISFYHQNKPNIFARATNRNFFISDRNYISENWRNWLSGDINPTELAQISYTTAISPCLAMELFDRQNKKGPATFFECLIGHIFARALDTEPEKRTTFEIEGRQVRMTMDFLFHMSNQVKVHLPVKMSTRERVVQAWSHQRLLDSAYGQGTYKGIMVLFSETKLDSRSHEVVEICVPDQWLAYQVLLAKMERIYYFDIPERYQALTNEFSDIITIKNFGEFFTERDSILHQ